MSVVVLLLSTTVAAASAAPPPSPLSSTNGDIMRRMVSTLHPRHPSWSKHTDWTEWAGVTTSNDDYYRYDITFTAATLGADYLASARGFLNATALDVYFPLVRFTVATLGVRVDFTNLPLWMRSINVTGSSNFTTLTRPEWSGRPNHVNLTKLPPSMSEIVLRASGLQGNVDIAAAVGLSLFDVSGNPGLSGSVDVTSVLVPSTSAVTNVVIQGTSLTTVFLRADTDTTTFVTTTTFPPSAYQRRTSGSAWALFVDASTTLVPLNVDTRLQILAGAYCRRPTVGRVDVPGSSSNTSLSMDVLVIPHPAAASQTVAMTARNRTCRFELPPRSPSGEVTSSGPAFFAPSLYIEGSAAWGSGLAVCTSDGDDGVPYQYASKGASAIDTIVIHRGNRSRSASDLVYELCDTSRLRGDPYYSMLDPVSGDYFVELVVNQTSARMRKFVTNNGETTTTTCTYPWPMLYNASTGAPTVNSLAGEYHPVYNQESVTAFLGPCFPPVDTIDDAAATATVLLTQTISAATTGSWSIGPAAAKSGGAVSWVFARFNSSSANRPNAVTLVGDDFELVPDGIYGFGGMNHHFRFNVSSTTYGVSVWLLSPALHNVRTEMRPMLMWPSPEQLELFPNTTLYSIKDDYWYWLNKFQSVLPDNDPVTGNPFGSFQSLRFFRNASTSGFILRGWNGRYAVFAKDGVAAAIPAGSYCAPIQFGESDATAVITVDDQSMVSMARWHSSAIGIGHTSSTVQVNTFRRCVPVENNDDDEQRLWTLPSASPPGRLSSGLAPVLDALAPCMPDASQLQKLQLPFVAGAFVAAPEDDTSGATITLTDSTQGSVSFNELACARRWNHSDPLGIMLCDFDDFHFTGRVMRAPGETVTPGISGPLVTAVWRGAGGGAFTRGYADVSSPTNLLPIASLVGHVAQSYLVASDIQSCVDTACYLRTDDCDALAAWTARVAACVIAQGKATKYNVPVSSEAADNCAADSSRYNLVSDWVRLDPREQRLRIDCSAESPSRRVLACGPTCIYGGYGIPDSAWPLPLADFGLEFECTPCVPLVVEGSIALPMSVLAFSAVFNVLLILATNYLLAPVVGPRLARLKVFLLAPILMLNHRERQRLRDRMLWHLRPEFLTDDEIDAHITAVVATVEAHAAEVATMPDAAGDQHHADDFVTRQRFERAYRSVLHDHERHLALACVAEKRSVLGCLLRVRSACARDVHVTVIAAENSTASATKYVPPSVPMVDGASGHTPPSSAVDASARASAQQHPDDASSNNDSNCSRGPTQQQLNVVAGVSGQGRCSAATTGSDAHAPLLRRRLEGPEERNAAAKPIGGDNSMDDDVMAVDRPVWSVAHFAEQPIGHGDGVGRALLALDANVDADWVAFARASQWLDRQCLIPQDWLLFVQAATVAAFYVSSIVSGVQSDGAGDQSRPPAGTKEWREYEASFFTFLNSTSPAALIINAGLRVAYGGLLPPQVAGQTRGQYVRRCARVFATDPFVAVSVLFVLPPLVTHVVPMWVVFLPFTVCYFGVLAAASVGVAKFTPPPVPSANRRAFVLALSSRLLLRVVATIAVVGALQFGFNYGVLMYDRPDLGWREIPTTEWNARSLACAVDLAESRGQGLFHRLMMLIS